MALADELQSGVPIVGAPALGDDLGLGRGLSLMAVLLAGPTLTGLVLEPVVLAWSDRVDRRPLLRAGLLGMALFPALAALLPQPWLLPWLVGLWGTSSGVACGIAQGAAVTSSGDPDRAMTRWTLAAVVGDVLAPLVLGLVVALGLPWRAAFGVAALAPLVLLAATFRVELPPLVEEDEDGGAAGDVRTALRSPVLPWLLAVASCNFLDEILLALVALRLDGRPDATAQMMALLAGGGLGLVAIELGWLTVDRRRLLVGSALASGLALLAWVATEDPILGGACLLAVGAAGALHYPLAKAAAYAAVPGRPGLVNALDGLLLSPADVLAPLLVGAVASGLGLRAALLVLLLQPIAVGLAALVARRAREG